MISRPKAIVFDIGAVLIEWDMRKLYRKMFADHDRMEWFLANVCTTAFNIEQDRGRSFADAVAHLSALHPEWRDEIRAYDERWPEMLGPPIAGTVGILERLQREGWPTYAITNFSREKFDIARKLHPYLDTFRGTVVSGDEKLVKPDPAIFRLFLDRYHLSAPDCVFIDDSKANVASAAELGFRALHFTSADQFADDLRQMGVLQC